MKIIRLLNMLDVRGLNSPSITGSITSLSDTSIDNMITTLSSSKVSKVPEILLHYVTELIISNRGGTLAAVYDYANKTAVDYRDGNDEDILNKVSNSNDPSRVIHWVVCILNNMHTEYYGRLDLIINIAASLVKATTAVDTEFMNQLRVNSDTAVRVRNDMDAYSVTALANLLKVNKPTKPVIADNPILQHYSSDEIVSWILASNDSEISEALEYINDLTLKGYTLSCILGHHGADTDDREALTAIVKDLEETVPLGIIELAKWVERFKK